MALLPLVRHPDIPQPPVPHQTFWYDRSSIAMSKSESALLGTNGIKVNVPRFGLLLMCLLEHEL